MACLEVVHLHSSKETFKKTDRKSRGAPGLSVRPGMVTRPPQDGCSDPAARGGISAASMPARNGGPSRCEKEGSARPGCRADISGTSEGQRGATTVGQRQSHPETPVRAQTPGKPGRSWTAAHRTPAPGARAALSRVSANPRVWDWGL